MFRMMKIYTVHMKPGEPATERKPLFIKEGFNVFAFVLSGFWTLYHRMWIHTVLIVAFNVLLASVIKGHLLNELGCTIVQTGFNLFVGFQANDWLRAKLLHDGYIFADVTAADSLLRAEQRYFERALAA